MGAINSKRPAGPTNFKGKSFLLGCIVVAAIFSASCVVDSSDDGFVDVFADTTPPTASEITPGDGDVMRTDRVIQISFSEDMNGPGLVLGGTMAAQATTQWLSNELGLEVILQISPTTAWTVGSGRTLTLSATDLSGNPYSQTLTYHVLDAVYVGTSGADTNPGTSDAPKLTVQAAIDLAAELVAASAAGTVPTEVRVIQGTYSVSGEITLANQVPLLGGYSSAAPTVRDAALYVTTIQDSRTTGGTSLDPNTLLSADSRVTGGTSVDGFTLRAGGGAYVEAVDISSAPLTIKNCIIQGGTNATTDSTAIDIFMSSGKSVTLENNTINGGSGLNTTAIEISGVGEPLIKNNIINGGAATTGSARGILLFEDARVENNTIDGGSSGNDTYGIDVSSAKATITNNTIKGGSAGTGSFAESKGIEMFGSASNSSSFTGNTISGGSGYDSYGIYLSSASPVVMKNTIDGGSGSNFSRGVYLSSSVAPLTNNVISGGASTAGESHGVYTTGSFGPALRNNTIWGGSGSTGSAGVIMFTSSRPQIVNNIIFTVGLAGNRYCIFEGGSTADPSEVRNNDLYDCPTGLYFDADDPISANRNITVLATMETNLENDAASIVHGGNVSANAAFVSVGGTDGNVITLSDNNWKLSATTPATITGGGLNLSISFTDDRDGNPRTLPWSMGAYEY